MFAGLDGFVVGLPVTSRGNIHDQNTDSIQVTSCFCSLAPAVNAMHLVMEGSTKS